MNRGAGAALIRKRADMTVVLPRTGADHRHPVPLRANEIDALVRGDGRDVLATMHHADRLVAVAAHTVPDRHLLGRLDDLVAGNGVEALAAIEVFGALLGDGADARLDQLARSDDPMVRRHAVWRLGGRRPVRSIIPTLAVELQRGGIDTFHAHRTLRRWSEVDRAAVLRAVTTELAVADDEAARARLIDLLGAVSDRGTDEFLVDVAVDQSELVAARLAAIGALGDRTSGLIGTALVALAHEDDIVGAHAALALEARRPVPQPEPNAGLRVAQLVMAGGLDGRLSRGGRGETGGVASLLVSLGAALAAHPSVEHVVTIGRGSVRDALVGPMVAEVADAREACSFGVIAIGDPARPVHGPSDAWEHIPAVERGLRRMLRFAGPVDVLHLRMADVGTVVGAEVATDMGIATCFSLAPDPHNVIQSVEGRGELDDDTFAALETEQHLWFRARLIERLGGEVDRVALFPRTTSLPFLDDLDRGEGAHRTAVIAEGVDLRAIERARREVSGTTTPDVVRALDEHVPAGRRGRPLLISVGRLDPVKGMERVVAAWAERPELRDSCNLVIVGGELDEPSKQEQSVLDAIGRTLESHPDARNGLVLLGGRPHADVVRLLTSAARGHGSAWAPGGVYVDGALKEEFGLAVLEAMASGLTVVAPSTGGPSTYVDEGDTGVLVAPCDDLGEAMSRAFGLAGAPGRADRARRMVESRYSVDTMAAQLVDLYGTAPRVEALPGPLRTGEMALP